MATNFQELSELLEMSRRLREREDQLVEMLDQIRGEIDLVEAQIEKAISDSVRGYGGQLADGSVQRQSRQRLH